MISNKNECENGEEEVMSIKEIIDGLSLIVSIIPDYTKGMREGLTYEECEKLPLEAVNMAISELEKLLPKEKPKTKLLFILTMPNVGSWNGKWVGEDKLYAMVKNAKKYPDCKEGNYYYSFGDGWGVNIEVKKVTANEANKYLRKSNGFYGYDWMIDSILHYGEILSLIKRDKLKNKKQEK